MCCTIEMKSLLEKHPSCQHVQWDAFRNMGLPVHLGWQGVILMRKDAFCHRSTSSARLCLCCRTKNLFMPPVLNKTCAAPDLLSHGPLCWWQKWPSVPQEKVVVMPGPSLCSGLQTHCRLQIPLETWGKQVSSWPSSSWPSCCKGPG